MAVMVAHIADFVDPSTSGLLGAAVVALVVGLAIENSYVKHGAFRIRNLHRPLALVCLCALLTVVAPAPGSAQTSTNPDHLPDLISDPPVIWRTRNIIAPDGVVIRVMTFDGYIHNIGTGALDVSGNPQIEGGMQQRVFDGNEWTPVGTPTIKFETNDGHNHFHLMRAVDYALWSIDRQQQVTDASKVGFCLVDTELREGELDAVYDIDAFNYCGVDDPDTTSLRMGITPGWRDTYDANVTLQWVDISNTTPGWYWVSAVTDPNDEIVESNEDNNDIVFSLNRFAVDGYVARTLEPQTASEPIELKAKVYGTVGARAFVVDRGPENGSLDVPIGVDLLDTNTVNYTPHRGFSGIDTFTYYAHDIATPFPTEPVKIEVTVEVDGDSDDVTDGSVDSSSFSVEDPGDQAGSQYEQVDLQLEISSDIEPTESVDWFASDLPPGLTINRQSGVITGIPTYAADTTSTVMARVGADLTEQTIQWSIARKDPPNLTPVVDFSTPGRALVTLPLGVPQEGATYQATGMPEGGSVSSNTPLVSGVPREAGTFAVTLEEVIDGQVVDSIQFNWTVRPWILPEFPL